MKKKKRNPQDATLRNIRALKKRVAELEVNLSTVAKGVEIIWDFLERNDPKAKGLRHFPGRFK